MFVEGEWETLILAGYSETQSEPKVSTRSALCPMLLSQAGDQSHTDSTPVYMLHW